MPVKDDFAGDLVEKRVRISSPQMVAQHPAFLSFETCPEKRQRGGREEEDKRYEKTSTWP